MINLIESQTKLLASTSSSSAFWPWPTCGDLCGAEHQTGRTPSRYRSSPPPCALASGKKREPGPASSTLDARIVRRAPAGVCLQRPE